MGKKRYSKERLTKLLKKWVSENGKIPTKKEINADPNDIVNIGLHFFLKNVRPYAASCSEA